MRPALILLCLLSPALAAPSLITKGAKRTRVARWALADLAPAPPASPIGQPQTGLLFAEGLGGHTHRVGPYRFATTGAARAAWFPEPLPPRARPIQLQVGDEARLAAQLRTGHLPTDGPPRVAYWLRAQLHDSPSGVLLSDWAVLGPEDGFPVPLHTLLHALQQRFFHTLQDTRARTLRVQRRKLPSRFVSAPTHREPTMHPSWDAARGRLVVTFHTRWTQTYTGPSEGEEVCPKCVCARPGNCAPCIPCRPRQIEPWVRVIGYDAAARYEVDAKGRLRTERLFLPKPLPPEAHKRLTREAKRAARTNARRRGRSRPLPRQPF